MWLSHTVSGSFRNRSLYYNSSLIREAGIQASNTPVEMGKGMTTVDICLVIFHKFEHITTICNWCAIPKWMRNWVCKNLLENIHSCSKRNITNLETIMITITGIYIDFSWLTYWKSYEGKWIRRGAYNKINNPDTNNHSNGPISFE